MYRKLNKTGTRPARIVNFEMYDKIRKQVMKKMFPSGMK